MSETCQMTMSDDGHNKVDGIAHYWKCGKPVKFVIQRRPEDRKLFVCGRHAASERKIATRLGFPLPTPL